jgi:putative OPT family oligopeptide transporter
MNEPSSGFQPLVAPSEQQPELTLRAIVLGAVLGLVFGVASTYLALKVGLTVSASVPIAVIAIAVLRRRAQQRAILEHNITQTTGSAGESVAAAVVFTVPALVLLGFPLEIGATTMIALAGGVLGVLMMVPLRRYLIVKEHGKLRYPEGKACAEILRVGEEGGTSAKKVFVGMGVGAALKAFQAIFGGAVATVGTKLSAFFGGRPAYFEKTYVGCDFDPALLGVGYIIGYRTSMIMVAGSVMSAFVLIPLIYTFGAQAPGLFGFGTKAIAEMTHAEIYAAYARHIGAGAVAMGGICALIRALPAIRSALWNSAKGMFGGGAAGSQRTDRDTPTPILLFGALGLVALIWLTPMFEMPLLGALLILGFGFLFAVVSSRVTGEVGSTSNPLSGMTIAVLMGTCGLFLALQWTELHHQKLALTIGAVVCIAVSQAGTCSQDLKTGFLVGATPVRQQGALVIGVLTSVLAVGSTVYVLNLAGTTDQSIAEPFQVAPKLLEGRERVVAKPAGGAPAPASELLLVRLELVDLPANRGLLPGSYLVDPTIQQALYQRRAGIGSERLPAPQASLMATVIAGILDQKLPWDLILIGAAIALFMELLGIGSLTFAVGLYLKIQYTMPVFLGGLVRKIADRRYRRVPDADEEPEGTLFSSGLIAGAAIVGVLAALQALLPGYDDGTGLIAGVAFLAELPFGAVGDPDPTKGSDVIGNLFGLALLAMLGFVMFRGARPRAAGTS